MIKNTVSFGKSKLHHGQKEVLFLLSLEGEKPQLTEVKESLKPLNVSIAIDISGSMSMALKNHLGPTPKAIINAQTRYDPLLRRLCEPTYMKTKMQMAKEAAVQAVKSMKVGDYISIIAFDNQSHIVVPATKLDYKNREDIIKKIEGLHHRGSTDIHSGWLMSATEVAKNISNQSLNRVLVLTDGQTNAGITNIDDIATHVSKLYNTSISTSTFGIGDDFNEDLLQSMSNSGGGNFYYVDDEQKLFNMFEEEFTGMSNIAASDIKLSFNLNKKVKVQSQLNKVTVIDNKYIIPGLANKQKLSLLFKFDIAVDTKVSKYDLGNANIEYVDSAGNTRKEKIKLSLEVVDKEVWNSLEENLEIKVQEALMIVAENKVKVTQALDSGNLRLAGELMGHSQMFIGSLGIDDARLNNEYKSLGETIAASNNMDTKTLRKVISTQSYQTRYNKS